MRKAVLLLGFLTLSWIASSQDTDSLQTIPVPRYVLWRMFHDIAIGKTCDSLQRFQADAIEQGRHVYLLQDSLLDVKSAQIRNLEQESYLWERRFINQGDIIHAKDAEIKQWKLRTLIGGVLIILIVML